MAGLEVSKNSLDEAMGTAARDLHVAFRRLREVGEFLATKTDAELEQLGYTTPEVTGIKSAFDDLTTLYRVYTGAQALANPTDFRRFLRRLYGLGGA